MSVINNVKKLTIEDKIEIIQSFENRNMEVEELMKKFAIGDTQLHGILKNKDIILEIWRHEVHDEQKKKERVTVYEEINETLYSWFLMAKASNMPLSGPILQERAKEIAKELGTVEFKASNGWLQGFKKRKGISFSRRIAQIPMFITPKVEMAEGNFEIDGGFCDYYDNSTDEIDEHKEFYTDQVENLKMYNLRPVNPSLHVKKDGNGGDGGVGSDSIGDDNAKNSTNDQLMNLKNASLIMPLKNEYTSSVAITTSTVVKHSSNPDMPRIKYYGSLRNNSNFSKMVPLNSPTLSKAVNTQAADYSNNNSSNGSNGPMTRLRRSGNEQQSASNSQQAAQKRPSAVLESKKTLPSTSALAQRLASNTSKNSSAGSTSNNTSRKSTLIDLASDEDDEKSFETSTPNKRLKPSNEPDISSLYGIPILDFSHDETVKQCSENGITAFIPLKALNSNEPSELCLPLIQVKDFEKKRFLFSTNRFLRIGTIKSINKSN